MSDEPPPTTPTDRADDERPDTSRRSARSSPSRSRQEMEQSFLDYAMSVIVSRALPDVRDGLKPVHRRILWAMYEGGLRPDRPHRKCATVVGDVLGKYHPHGDQSVYDALVRMGQDFSLRHPLIDPHGNFGSPDRTRRPPTATPSAGSRRSPCTCSPGIDEDTVDFVANFDGSTEEPTVLPARFPNLLVNGSQGIAVGMATNIPPHNLGEVIDATIHLIDNPDATVDDLMQFVKGPDFPTGGLIMGRAGLVVGVPHRPGLDQACGPRPRSRRARRRRADRRHRDPVPDLGRADRGEDRRAGQRPRASRASARSATSRSKGSTRLVIELKRDAPANVILNNLYKHTPLQTTLRGEHGGAGRRRAAHAQPARRARRTTSTTRSRSSPAAREFRLRQGASAGPTSSRASSRRST